MTLVAHPDGGSLVSASCSTKEIIYLLRREYDNRDQQQAENGAYNHPGGPWLLSSLLSFTSLDLSSGRASPTLSKQRGKSIFGSSPLNSAAAAAGDVGLPGWISSVISQTEGSRTAALLTAAARKATNSSNNIPSPSSPRNRSIGVSNAEDISFLFCEKFEHEEFDSNEVVHWGDACSYVALTLDALYVIGEVPGSSTSSSSSVGDGVGCCYVRRCIPTAIIADCAEGSIMDSVFIKTDRSQHPFDAVILTHSPSDLCKALSRAVRYQEWKRTRVSRISAATIKSDFDFEPAVELNAGDGGEGMFAEAFSIDEDSLSLPSVLSGCPEAVAPLSTIQDLLSTVLILGGNLDALITSRGGTVSTSSASGNNNNLASSLTTPGGAGDEAMDDLKEEIQTLKKENSLLRRQAKEGGEAKGAYDALHKEKTVLQRQLAVLEADITAMKKERATMKQEIRSAHRTYRDAFTDISMRLSAHVTGLRAQHVTVQGRYQELEEIISQNAAETPRNLLQSKINRTWTEASNSFEKLAMDMAAWSRAVEKHEEQSGGGVDSDPALESSTPSKWGLEGVQWPSTNSLNDSQRGSITTSPTRGASRGVSFAGQNEILELDEHHDDEDLQAASPSASIYVVGSARTLSVALQEALRIVDAQREQLDAHMLRDMMGRAVARESNMNIEIGHRYFAKLYRNAVKKAYIRRKDIKEDDSNKKSPPVVAASAATPLSRSLDAPSSPTSIHVHNTIPPQFAKAHQEEIEALEKRLRDQRRTHLEEQDALHAKIRELQREAERVGGDATGASNQAEQYRSQLNALKEEKKGLLDVIADLERESASMARQHAELQLTIPSQFAKVHEEEIEALEKRLRDQRRTHLDEQDLLQAKIRDLQREAERVGGDVSSVNAEAEQYKTQLQALKEEKRKLLDSMAAVERESTKRQTELQTTIPSQFAKAHQEEIEALEKRLRDQRRTHLDEQDALENKIRELQREAERVGGDVSNISSQAEQFRSQLQILKEEKKGLLDTIAELEHQSTRRQRELQTTIPTQLAKVHEEEIEALEKRLREQRTANLKEQDALQAKIRDLQREAERVGGDVSSVNAEAEQYRTQVKTLKEEKKGLLDVIADLEHESATVARKQADLRFTIESQDAKIQSLQREKKDVTEKVETSNSENKVHYIKIAEELEKQVKKCLEEIERGKEKEAKLTLEMLLQDHQEEYLTILLEEEERFRERILQRAHSSACQVMFKIHHQHSVAHELEGSKSGALQQRFLESEAALANANSKLQAFEHRQTSQRQALQDEIEELRLSSTKSASEARKLEIELGFATSTLESFKKRQAELEVEHQAELQRQKEKLLSANEIDISSLERRMATQQTDMEAAQNVAEEMKKKRLLDLQAKAEVEHELKRKVDELGASLEIIRDIEDESSVMRKKIATLQSTLNNLREKEASRISGGKQVGTQVEAEIVDKERNALERNLQDVSDDLQALAKDLASSAARETILENEKAALERSVDDVKERLQETMEALVESETDRCFITMQGEKATVELEAALAFNEIVLQLRTVRENEARDREDAAHRAVSSQLEDELGQVIGETTRLGDELATTTAALEAAEATRKEQEVSLATLTEQLQQHQDVQKRLEELQAKFMDNKVELKKKTSELTQLESECEVLKDLFDKERDLKSSMQDDLDALLAKLEHNNEEITESVADTNRSVSDSETGDDLDVSTNSMGGGRNNRRGKKGAKGGGASPQTKSKKGGVSTTSKNKSRSGFDEPEVESVDEVSSVATGNASSAEALRIRATKAVRDMKAISTASIQASKEFAQIKKFNLITHKALKSMLNNYMHEYTTEWVKIIVNDGIGGVLGGCMDSIAKEGEYMLQCAMTENSELAAQGKKEFEALAERSQATTKELEEQRQEYTKKTSENESLTRQLQLLQDRLNAMVSDKQSLSENLDRSSGALELEKQHGGDAKKALDHMYAEKQHLLNTVEGLEKRLKKTSTETDVVRKQKAAIINALEAVQEEKADLEVTVQNLEAALKRSNAIDSDTQTDDDTTTTNNNKASRQQVSSSPPRSSSSANHQVVVSSSSSPLQHLVPKQIKTAKGGVATVYYMCDHCDGKGVKGEADTHVAHDFEHGTKAITSSSPSRSPSRLPDQLLQQFQQQSASTPSPQKQHQRSFGMLSPSSPTAGGISAIVELSPAGDYQQHLSSPHQQGMTRDRSTTSDDMGMYNEGNRSPKKLDASSFSELVQELQADESITMPHRARSSTHHHQDDSTTSHHHHHSSTDNTTMNTSHFESGSEQAHQQQQGSGGAAAVYRGSSNTSNPATSTYGFSTTDDEAVGGGGMSKSSRKNQYDSQYKAAAAKIHIINVAAELLEVHEGGSPSFGSPSGAMGIRQDEFTARRKVILEYVEGKCRILEKIELATRQHPQQQQQHQYTSSSGAIASAWQGAAAHSTSPTRGLMGGGHPQQQQPHDRASSPHHQPTSGSPSPLQPALMPTSSTSPYRSPRPAATTTSTGSSSPHHHHQQAQYRREASTDTSDIERIASIIGSDTNNSDHNGSAQRQGDEPSSPPLPPPSASPSAARSSTQRATSVRSAAWDAEMIAAVAQTLSLQQSPSPARQQQQQQRGRSSSGYLVYDDEDGTISEDLASQYRQPSDAGHHQPHQQHYEHQQDDDDHNLRHHQHEDGDWIPPPTHEVNPSPSSHDDWNVQPRVLPATGTQYAQHERYSRVQHAVSERSGHSSPSPSRHSASVSGGSPSRTTTARGGLLPDTAASSIFSRNGPTMYPTDVSRLLQYMSEQKSQPLQHATAVSQAVAGAFINGRSA